MEIQKFNNKHLRPPKPWEVLGMIFGYFAVAKDVPSTFRILCVPKLVPDFLKRFLLLLYPDPNFWILILFTLSAFGILWYLWPTRLREVPDPNEATYFKEASRERRWRVIRSLGLVWIREKLLDYFGIHYYGTFKRPLPPNWELAPDRADDIDRIIFKDQTGMEVQYANDFLRIFIRHHTAGTNPPYGNEEIQLTSWKEFRLLLVASNYFWWWSIRHLMKTKGIASLIKSS